MKELIRGSLRKLAESDDGVTRELETFVARQLKRELSEPESNSSQKYLAKILLSSSPQDSLVEQYVEDLTGSSLQSAGQLERAAKALGLTANEIGLDSKKLKPIFHARNKMIHELDINLGKTAARRNRNSRRETDMRSWANELIELTTRLVEAVEKKIASAG